MTTMKAIVLREFGAPDNLSLQKVEAPKPRADEVLIRVKASGLNGADLLQRKGHYPPPKDASPLLGLEVSGVVEDLGKEVPSPLKKGQNVMALLSGGGYAEYVTVRHDQILPIPSSVSLTAAGGIPEVFLTAYLELIQLGRLKKGESVLIHAGASGVGSAAIQIAKAVGAEVWVTAGSDEKLSFCRSLGADHTVNYKTESFVDLIKEKTGGRGVDCILDLVGASHFPSNIRSLALEGRLLLVGLSGGVKSEINLSEVLSKRIEIIGSTLRSRSLDFKAKLIRDFWSFAERRFESGEFKPLIDREFSAEDARSAHEYMETKANKGKVLLVW